MLFLHLFAVMNWCVCTSCNWNVGLLSVLLVWGAHHWGSLTLCRWYVNFRLCFGLFGRSMWQDVLLRWSVFRWRQQSLRSADPLVSTYRFFFTYVLFIIHLYPEMCNVWIASACINDQELEEMHPSFLFVLFLFGAILSFLYACVLPYFCFSCNGLCALLERINT